MEDRHRVTLTKDKILLATLDIIAEQGFQNVTVRKIAAMADVNVAAVNYHFGSKDALINEALKIVTLQLENAFNCLKEEQIKPLERLALFLKRYSETLFKYPDIVKNMINHSIHDHPVGFEVEYQKYLKEEGVSLIRKTISQIRPQDEATVVYMRALQLICCMSFPILLGNRIIEISGVDITDAEQRLIYTDLLLKNILGGNYF